MPLKTTMQGAVAPGVDLPIDGDPFGPIWRRFLRHRHGIRPSELYSTPSSCFLDMTFTVSEYRKALLSSR